MKVDGEVATNQYVQCQLKTDCDFIHYHYWNPFSFSFDTRTMICKSHQPVDTASLGYLRENIFAWLIFSINYVFKGEKSIINIQLLLCQPFPYNARHSVFIKNGLLLVVVKDHTCNPPIACTLIVAHTLH